MRIRKSHFLALTFLLSTATSANGLRCGTKLVLEGESTYDVIQKCGQPDSQEDLGFIRKRDDYVKVTRYIYDMGNGKFLRLLDFHNGKLIKIADGPRQ
ncbi:DUF2845 domain-containing protein [Alteromonas sp. NFXS44]|uniref:DUF2845 domain-containing protein n=1 Tax=Alteromonas sp. NFXS44 TaxID=2818435 RepID=UPI0026B537C5